MIVDKYFSAFGNKDISTIESLLADDVILHDPTLGKLRGKKKVLRATQNIFNSGGIHIKIIDNIKDKEKRAVEFILTIANKNGNVQKVHGVDIFSLKDDRITLIKAFLNIMN